MNRPTPARPGRHDGGQATVELAIGFPIVLIGVLLVLQLGLVGRDQLLVSHAAREAARAAAVHADRGAARDGALASTTGLDPGRLEVDARRTGDRVHIGLRYQSRTALPLVGPLLPDPELRASVTMAVEDRWGDRSADGGRRTEMSRRTLCQAQPGLDHVTRGFGGAHAGGER